jgi:nucleotide-binding universal stress UspA family protein
MRLLTLRTVLVATDLDESCVPVLHTAARLALLAGASLHLLHVAAAQEEEGEDRLRAYFRRATSAGVEPASVRAAFGYPAAVIVEHAGRLGADVIVVGPHRRRAIAGPLGSTAASVVRAARCPCLVASTELRLPLERVLVALDIADPASGALAAALTWASALRPRSGQASLTVLHVSQDPGTNGTHRLLQQEIDRTMEGAYDAARVSIGARVLPGTDPAAVILREVASSAVNLLVMGTRTTAGRSSELGSVSAAVARAASCPLLLVPPASPPPSPVR